MLGESTLGASVHWRRCGRIPSAAQDIKHQARRDVTIKLKKISYCECANCENKNTKGRLTLQVGCVERERCGLAGVGNGVG